MRLLHLQSRNRKAPVLTLALGMRNSYNPDSMNSTLSGAGIALDGHELTVDAGARVLVDGRSPRAGDGVAAALARRVVPDLAADSPERTIAVDQTNTSVIVDDRYVVKIVARWAAADRAGTLLERLAAAGSDDVARLFGRVLWQHPRWGTSTLALITEFLDGASDGWTWAVDDVLAAVTGGPEPDWPGPLGRLVARVHDVLGADAEPAAADAGATRYRRAADALAEAVAAASGPSGARLLNRRTSLEDAMRTLRQAAPGVEFAIHGDLHVGQVLASPMPDGGRRFTLIDFDGDPRLDVDSRARPDAAARDLAHMTVSFDLVAAVAQRRLGRAEPRAFDWADRARAAFLAAYRTELRTPGLFDESLLPGFEAEQLAAELLYADRFLPLWRYAPDAVITYRHPSSDDHPEEPWTPPPFDPTSN